MSKRLFWGICLIALFQFSVLTVQAEEAPSIDVSATASLNVAPDKVVLTIGIVSQDKEATKAVDANAKLSEQVSAALRQMGVTDSGLKTSAYSIRPDYSMASKVFGKAREIEGYTVSNSLLVESDQVGQVGKLIDAAVQAGANDINSIVFGLKDTRLKREEAIRQATASAKEDAQFVATASGLQLLEVIAVEVDNGGGSVVGFRPRVEMLSREASVGSSPVIQAGDVQVSATVRLRYAFRAS